MATFEERAFIAQFEAADADDLVQLLRHPSVEQEKALRAYLGDDRYQRMHGIALRCGINRGERQPRGNLVVIPGFLGSELTVTGPDGVAERVWLDIPRIMAGRLQRLRLGDDGLGGPELGYEVHASGILKRLYGELLLSLSRGWNVRAFSYDWRKDLNLAAGDLMAKISGWFGVDAPVHIVAHGMGGLVARTFLKNYRVHWNSMRDRRHREPGRGGGRLILLGTPNHGSFLALQSIAGLTDVVRNLATIGPRVDMVEILKIVNSFVSIYQMLPSPLVLKGMGPLYEAATYGEQHVSRHLLRTAREFHERLATAVDTGRMVQILGHGAPTVTGISDPHKVTDPKAYEVGLAGDGNVSLALGLLRTADGSEAQVPSYFVDADHVALISSPRILAALEDLLEDGKTTGLDTQFPPDYDRAVTGARRGGNAPASTGDDRLARLADRLRIRGVASGTATVFSAEERELSEGLTRNLFAQPQQLPRPTRAAAPFSPPRIEFGLVCGRIDAIDYDSHPTKAGKHSVDAIAVGHYVGVKPQGNELDLDRAISRALPGQSTRGNGVLRESDLVLTQYSERGIIRGELGQPFFLSDPRVTKGSGRLLAVVGMGLPGRFGVPELTVLVRELCWSVGRMGCRHLATAQIGTRNENLTAEDAISAWVRGIKAAITGAIEDERRHLLKVTFVIDDPRKIARIQDAILVEQRKIDNQNRIIIDYEPLDESELKAVGIAGLKRDRQDVEKELRKRRSEPGGDAALVPTRVTLGMDRNAYRFGAITENAAIPERTIPLDPALVLRANDELAAEADPDMQLERGKFLERLLIPAELRAGLASPAPLVMLLDSTTARIHWEMVALSDPTFSAERTDTGDRSRSDFKFEFEDYFLGTSRGFTRQLRTSFAPPPEPPPPPRRILRVLVVADPAEDARLPGAEEEGVEVADLFEAFNAAYGGLCPNRVEVVRLFGPREATRTNVLRHLMLRSYDVLHFAGHCVYDAQDPPASGWIFSGGERLSANELNRIDRVPKFVFSNACESGITPDRAELRSAALAPSFAESFFARGVSNFVCTAWPVDDAAARRFALEVYGVLLGLSPVEGRTDRFNRVVPRTIHIAMRKARVAIAPTPEGLRSWGAYQHYGNPFFQFFDPTMMPAPNAQTAEGEGTDRQSAEPPVSDPQRNGGQHRKTSANARNEQGTDVPAEET